VTEAVTDTSGSRLVSKTSTKMRPPTFLLSSIFFLAGSLPGMVESHGALQEPRQWSDATGEWFPCPLFYCVEDVIETMNKSCEIDNWSAALNAWWFTNYTFIPGERTLAPAMRTYPQLETYAHPKYDSHPWMSPGSAPVSSPCGALGGNRDGLVGSADDTTISNLGGGWIYGPLAEEYYVAPGFPDVVTTEWAAGSVVEASWYIYANHGGGYSYRLCKVPEEGVGGLTEECFKQGQLEFFGDKQWIQYEKDGPRFETEALRTREGTFPEGSQWTRNPIPNCRYLEETGPEGEQVIPDSSGYYDCRLGFQFPPPSGLSVCIREGQSTPPPHIVDLLVVPRDLAPGDYVLSFRWDCEETFQIYNSCANVRIVE